MSRLPSTFVLLRMVVAVLVVACTAIHDRPQGPPLLGTGFWVGAVGYDIWLLDGGQVFFRQGGPKGRLESLDDDEIHALKSLLSSEDFARAVEWLRELEYEFGCCDVPEVYILTEGGEYAFPICDDGTSVPPSVKEVLSLLNTIGKAHFGRRFSEIPSHVCAYGAGNPEKFLDSARH